MTTNRYHPFADYNEWCEAALDGRLILWQAGGHEGVVLPRMPTTAPVVVTKEMVDDVIEQAAQRNRDERIAQLEAELFMDDLDTLEMERDVAHLLGVIDGIKVVKS